MATSIGAIVVEFIANIAKFRTDVESAQAISAKGAKGIQASFNSIGGSITGAIGALSRFTHVLGAVAGGAGIGLMIKNAVQAGDRIAEMAQRVGISTDALQELGHAAALSGASIEDLENGLKFLNKNLGEAQTGSKELAEAFAKIGVDPTKFRDAGEAIGAVADGINALGNQAQKTEALLAIFGRGGNQLAILLGEGSKGIAKLREEAQKLGIVLDSATLKEAQRLADDFDRLAAVIKGNLTRALIDLGPALLKVTRLLADFAQYAGYLTNVYKDIGATNETASLEELANRIVDVKNKITELKAEQAELRAGGYGIRIDPKALPTLEAQLFALKELLRTRQTLEARPPDVGMTITGVSGPTKDQLKSLDDFRKKLVLLAIPDETARSVVSLRQEVAKLAEAGGPLAGQLRAIGTAMEALIVQAAVETGVGKLLDDIESGVITIDGVTKSVKQLAAEQAPFASSFEHSSLSVKDTDAAVAKLLDDIEAGDITYQHVTKSVKQLAAEQAGMADAFGGTLEPIKAVKAEGNALIESLQRQLTAFSLSEKAAFVYAETMKLAADATAAEHAQVRLLAGQLYELKKQQDEHKQYYADLKSIVVNTSLTASDALVDWALTGEISFKKMADAIIRDILRIITKMLVLKAIEMSINAFGGGGVTGAAAGGTINVAGAASGGIVKARPGGRLMLVGEGGSDEAIIPLSQLGGAGGVNVSVEVINQTGTPVSQQTEQTTGPDGQQMLRVFLRKEVSGAISDGAFDPQMASAFGIRRRGVAR